MMKTHIQKWGNSLAVRIPKVFAEEIGIEAESEIELTLINGVLVIKVPESANEYKLEDLVAQITDENRHSEVSTGSSVGNEAW